MLNLTFAFHNQYEIHSPLGSYGCTCWIWRRSQWPRPLIGKIFMLRLKWTVFIIQILEVTVTLTFARLAKANELITTSPTIVPNFKRYPHVCTAVCGCLISLFIVNHTFLLRDRYGLQADQLLLHKQNEAWHYAAEKYPLTSWQTMLQWWQHMSL